MKIEKSKKILHQVNTFFKQVRNMYCQTKNQKEWFFTKQKILLTYVFAKIHNKDHRKIERGKQEFGKVKGKNE